jgi:hypothetical protein
MEKNYECIWVISGGIWTGISGISEKLDILVSTSIFFPYQK